MAITPRTILTSAAPATVAVVSLYFFTVLGTTAFTCLTDTEESTDDFTADDSATEAEPLRSTSCEHVAARFGADDKASWSEFAWVNYTYCFHKYDESEAAINAARQGLEHHSNSEPLYNLKGYHQTVLERYAEAIDTLERGLEAVDNPRNGVMANNLAWAGLWEPRKMHLEDAREYYVRSLALSPDVCETLHTGLFVEYAIADQAKGLDRFDSLKRFSELRNRYNRCLDRLGDGERKTVVEIIGAAVLFQDIDHVGEGGHPLMRSATATLIDEQDNFSVDAICQDAMPLADYHHDCVQAVKTSIEQRRAVNERHEQRDERAAEVKEEIIEQYGEDYPVLLNNTEPAAVEVTSGCGGMIDAE